MLNEKVVELNPMSVFSDIQVYLDSLDNYSNNTRSSYEKNIREFFIQMKGKEIEHLEKEDLVFKKNDILEYRQWLLDKGNVYNTVNQKIASLRSFYKELESNEYEVNSSIFHMRPLRGDDNSYGSLSQTEADRMADWVLENERFRPFMKHCLILFATRTSYRLNEILSAKWSDLRYVDGICIIKLRTKGNKHRETSFHGCLYEKILKLKEENKQYEWNKDNDLIFQLSVKSINKMMDRIRTGLNIPKERRVVFHSFRGIAIDYELETSGDIKKAQLHAGHSDMNTTYKHYINKTKDFSQTPGVRMDEEIDWSILDDLTTEQLKKIIINGGYKFYAEAKNILNRS